MTQKAYNKIADGLNELLAELRQHEYREILQESGCPADKIEDEIAKLVERPTPRGS